MLVRWSREIMLSSVRGTLVKRPKFSAISKIYCHLVIKMFDTETTELGLPDEQNKTELGRLKLCLPDGENKIDVGQLSDTKLCLPDGETRQPHAGQLSDTMLWLPDGEENKTNVGQLSDTKLWLPDGENKTGVLRTAERHEAMLA